MKTKPLCPSSGFRALLLVLIIVTLPHSAHPADKTLEVSRVKPLARTWAAKPDTLKAYPYSDFGGELRLRWVDFQNAMGLGSEADPRRRFFRVRGRLWYQRDFAPGARIVAGLTNETFMYLECETCDSELGEIIFEKLYFEWIKQTGHPMGLRIGRQDLFYGDGLLVCDGGPLDGSRTIYVNGAALTSAIPLWAFDIFAAYNPKTDEYLPRINNKHKKLIEHNEFLAGIMTRRLGPGGAEMRFSIEPYYIYKEEIDSPRTAKIHTLGARLAFPIWKARFATELAYQTGQVPRSRIPKDSPVKIPDLAGPQSISAYAATVKLRVDLGEPISGNVTLGYIHLQGDERTTRNKYEGWNPVLGRWPIWSELYIYTLFMEREAHPMQQGVAFWQNLKAPYVDIRVGPHKHLIFLGRYMKLGADESIFSDPRNEGPLDRGDLLVFRLSYSPLPDWSAHLHFEAFRPGSYYDPYFDSVEAEGPEDATFFRIEVKKSF